MDAPSESAALSITAIVISVGGIILGAINHKRVRSTCCGKKMDASLDIETTTPQGAQAKIQIPPPAA